MFSFLVLIMSQNSSENQLAEQLTCFIEAIANLLPNITES